MINSLMRFLPLLIIFLLNAACTPKARYERELKRELSSGIRYDTIFFGIHLGMTSKEFYTHCWNLNKQGLVKQGSNNRSVEYFTREELRHAAAMNFYPTFNKNKIVEMPVRFSYKAWSPGNKSLSADSLQKDVIDWYAKQYGDDFIRVRHPSHGVAFVKIDGNRRITIFKENELYVWAIFRDMTAEMPEKDSFGEKSK
jgi:hypothetical protein